MLRLERLKRVVAARHILLQAALRALQADQHAPAQAKVLASQRLALFSSWGRKTKQRSRCWFSGRARQVRRSLLLARMHARSHAAHGALPQFYRRRS